MPTLFSPNIHLLMNMSGGLNSTVLSFQYEQHLRHVQEDETLWFLNGQNDSV